MACKRVDITKSDIGRYGVHWKIQGKQSCGATLCGSTNNVKGCKGGECHWGESTTIHKSVGGNRTIHIGVGDGISTTKGDGDREAWVGNYNEEKMCDLGNITLLDKGIKILDLERFMWTQMKRNYDKYVE